MALATSWSRTLRSVARRPALAALESSTFYFGTVSSSTARRHVNERLRGDSIPLEEHELPRPPTKSSSTSSSTGKKKKSSMDDILNDVLVEAMAARDRGEQPDMDFVYKKTQEKCYEAEHGRPPPSKNSTYEKHLPLEPDDRMRRVMPLALYETDLWPERSHARKGTDNAPDPTQGGPKDAAMLLADFTSAIDELSHWEAVGLEFVRAHPLGLRRSLPLLQDRYKHIAHRLQRAHLHYVDTRNAVVGKGVKMSTATYALTEDRVDRVRMFFIETHKALTSNYDPLRMRKSFTGRILQMTDDEFAAWKSEDAERRNVLIAALDAPPSEAA